MLFSNILNPKNLCDISVCKFTENITDANIVVGVFNLYYVSASICGISIIPRLNVSSFSSCIALSASDTARLPVPVSCASRVILIRMVLGPVGDKQCCLMKYTILPRASAGVGCQSLRVAFRDSAEIKLMRFMRKMMNSSDMRIRSFLSISTVSHVLVAMNVRV